jgi:hypothetical protein
MVNESLYAGVVVGKAAIFNSRIFRFEGLLEYESNNSSRFGYPFVKTDKNLFMKRVSQTSNYVQELWLGRLQSSMTTS